MNREELIAKDLLSIKAVFLSLMNLLLGLQVLNHQSIAIID